MKRTLRTLCGTLLVAAGLVLAAGCTPPRPTKTEPKAGHDHAEKGPHGGLLAGWGDEEMHAEFTVDRGKKQATVYILDGKAKNAVPIEAETIKVVLTSETPPMELVLKADPSKDDPKGKSSRFVSDANDKLAKEGEFKDKIIGPKYTGEFPEKD